ncbi:unnamed protein product [Merluccius merluccius]
MLLIWAMKCEKMACVFPALLQFFQKLTASPLGPGVEEVSGVEEGCGAEEGPVAEEGPGAEEGRGAEEGCEVEEGPGTEEGRGAGEGPARGGNSAGVGDRLEGRVVEWGDDDDAMAAWSLGGEPEVPAEATVLST